MRIEQFETRETRDTPLAQSGHYDRALMSIVADLWTHTELLMRQELDLVRADLDQKVTRAKRDLTAASASGAVLYAGVLALVAGVIGLISMWLPTWIAAGIVGLVLVLVGAVVMRRSTKDLAEMEKMPTEAGRSLERTAYTVKEATQ